MKAESANHGYRICGQMMANADELWLNMTYLRLDEVLWEP